MRGRYGGDIQMFYEYDVALCDITLKDGALSLLQVLLDLELD